MILSNSPCDDSVLALDVNSIIIADLRISEATESSLSIEWTSLVDSLPRNSLPVTVRITVTALPFGRTISIVMIDDGGNFTQTGLQPGTLYSFQLIVVYEGALGRNSTTITGMTLHCEKNFI